MWFIWKRIQSNKLETWILSYPECSFLATMFKSKVPPSFFQLSRTPCLSRKLYLGSSHQVTRYLFQRTAVYRVRRVLAQLKPELYELSDLQLDPVDGFFYRKNLILCPTVPIEPGFFVINKIIKERVKNGQKEVFVSFLNYESKFNTWITENDAVTELPKELKQWQHQSNAWPAKICFFDWKRIWNR